MVVKRIKCAVNCADCNTQRVVYGRRRLTASLSDAVTFAAFRYQHNPTNFGSAGSPVYRNGAPWGGDDVGVLGSWVIGLFGGFVYRGKALQLIYVR